MVQRNAGQTTTTKNERDKLMDRIKYINANLEAAERARHDGSHWSIAATYQSEANKYLKGTARTEFRTIERWTKENPDG